MSDEQRQSERARVWLPLRLKSDADDTPAVTYDTSERGAMILAPRSFPVGTKVSVTFELPFSGGGSGGRSEGGEPPTIHTATGLVVRAEPNVDDPNGLWPHRVAVTFDEPVPALVDWLHPGSKRSR